MDKSATTKPKFNPLPVIIIVFAVLSSATASGLYFYYVNYIKPEVEDKKIAYGNILEPDDELYRNFEKASLQIKIPENFTATEVENTLEIKKDDIKINILFGNLKNSSLLSFAKSTAFEKGFLVENENTVKIGSRVGVSYYKDGDILRFFPSNKNGFVEISNGTHSQEENDIIEEIIQSIKFSLL